MSNVGDSNQTPDKPLTIWQKIKLFFTLHTILALLIAGFGSWFLTAKFDMMSRVAFVFWYTLISVVTTLLILVWYNNIIKPIKLDSDTLTPMWYWIIGSFVIDCIVASISQELGGYIFLGVLPAVVVGFILSTIIKR